jgi:hypothetical protein
MLLKRRRAGEVWGAIQPHGCAFMLLKDRQRVAALAASGGEGSDWAARVPTEFRAQRVALYEAWYMDDGRGPNNSDLGATMPGSCHHLIDTDVPRTFGAFFSGKSLQRAQSMQEPLRRVLNVVAATSQSGYSQSMSFVVALLLLNGLSEANTYAIFVFLLEQRHLGGLYHRHSSFMHHLLRWFEWALTRLTNVSEHLAELDFPPALYAGKWFETIFVCSFDLDVSAAAVDMILCGVEDVLPRVAGEQSLLLSSDSHSHASSNSRISLACIFQLSNLTLISSQWA